ncbi:BAG domain-containing protein Samui [Clonorchis sinensis]|uniref:BAG domain-containing protein Samui n=1 Tax=Clonorchis sinensis TaxID=79923 RepID=G7Y9L7_CLOSI|nr:BAG domain-containing protein Samui [Clonorchis sinensis]
MPEFGFGTSMYQPTSRPPSFGTGSLPRNIPIQVVKHEVTRSPTPRRVAQSPEADRSSCSTPRHSEEPQTGNEQIGSDAGPGEDSKRERDNNSIEPPQEDDNERCSSLKTVPSFEPIPLPYYSLPTQLPTVSVEELKQSTKNPTEAPTNSASDKPQPPPVTSYDLISNALDELELLKPEVDAFASPDKDKQYIYLEDRLDKLVSKIDQIEADGDEAVRSKRREAIKQVLGTINLLEQKLASAKSSSNQESCKSDTQAEPDSTTLSDPETSTVPTTTEPSA